MTSSTGELLLADTSFISAWARAGEGDEGAGPWSGGTMQRFQSATIAISVVTVAEVRHGHWIARWGTRRLKRAERWLGTFMQFPVEGDVAEEWARLKATGQRAGRTFGANDLWIAATGYARGLPVVTCDRDFLPMRELGVRVIYLPRRPTSAHETS
jgi:predicted nucleic acid-binding protein